MDNTPHTPNSSSTRRRRKAFDLAIIGDLKNDWDVVSESSIDRATLIVLRAKSRSTRPIGTAVAAVRMSTTDQRNGFTIAAQLNEVIGYAGRNGLRVGYVVVSTENSGAREYAQRPDLLEIERLVANGLCTDVLWRDVSRIARDKRAFLDHTAVMTSTGTRMHVTQSGKVIEPDDSEARLVTAMQLEMAVSERQTTASRTQGGVWTSCIATGKGSNRRNPFGLTKNADGWLIPCPVNWKWATFIHHAYDALKTANDPAKDVQRLLAERGVHVTLAEISAALNARRGPAGIRAVVAILELAGFERTIGFVNDILRNAMYVDGRFTQTRSNITVEMKPIPLDDPVDAECFARNQLALGQARGSLSRSRYQNYAIVGLVRCDACGASMRAINLRRDGTRGYICSAPVGTCVRPAINAHDLDRRVAEIVRELDVCDDALMAAWQNSEPVRQRALAALENDRIAHDLNERHADLRAKLADLTRSISESAEADVADFDAYFAQAFAERGGVAIAVELNQVERAMNASEGIKKTPRARKPSVPVRDRLLEAAFARILTIEPASSKGGAIARSAVMHDAVSAVIAKFDPSNPDVFTIRVEGALTPLDQRLHGPVPPSVAARESIERNVRSVNSSLDYQTVRTLIEKFGVKEAIVQMQGMKTAAKQRTGTPDWIVEFEIPAIKRRQASTTWSGQPRDADDLDGE